MDRDREEFHQFYTLVQEKGGIVLRNVIQYLYNEDGILNFEQFLTHYKHKLFHELWQPNKACCPFGGPTCYKSEPSKKPILTGTQWMQLYKKNLSSMPHRDIGPCPCQWIAQTAKDLIDELDFTLLCQILKNIYAANKLSKLQLDATDLVKSERNKLSHPKQLKVEDFTTRWEKVKNSLLDLAKICFQPDQLKSLEDDIDRLKTRPVTNKDFENLEKIIIYDRESQEQLHKKLKKDVSEIKSLLLNQTFAAKNCSVKVKVQSQCEDIRKTKLLIEHAEESMQNVSKDVKKKLKSFITEINDLKEHFDECTPFEECSEDDLDECSQDYEHLVGTWGKTSLEECWKELQEKNLIVYIKEEYEALDEENWKEIEAIRYPVQTVKKKNEIQKAEIDKKLKKAVIEEHLCRSAQCQNEIRVVIVGKTGVGKSALGNLLLQIPSYFEESIGPSSMTAKVKEGNRLLGKRKLRVLDTPGLFDTDRTFDEVKTELAKCVLKFRDGFHAMAVVLNGSNLKYTPEEQKAVAEIKNIFGHSIMNYCFVVITHMGGMKKDITAEQFVDEIEQEEFRKLVYEDFGRRLMFIENTASSLYEQKGFINAFICMVDNIQKLQNNVYTDGMFKEAKRIFDAAKKEENERKEQQIKDEFRKYDSLKIAIKKIVDKKYPKKTLQNVNQMNGDVESKMKQEIISAFHATPEQEEFMQKYPDKNLISNICNEIIEKKKNKEIVSLYNRETETVSVDDISLSVDENSLIKILFRELHGAVGDVVESYLKDDTAREEIESTEEVSADTIKTLSERVQNKLSAEAKKYFSKDTVVGEIDYKIKKEKKTLRKVGQTTESKLKSSESGEGASPVCFPADAMVYASRGLICMSDIMIGDQVLTIDSKTKLPKYEDVIMLSHAEHDPVTEMIQIVISNSQKITLSPGHLLHLNSNGNLVAARLVTKGDNICAYINNRFVWSQVTGVCTIKKKGLYCPHTTGGSIIVGGVLASCGTEHVSQNVTKASMYVVKMLYFYLPSVVYKLLYGKNRTQDVPYLLNKLKPIYFKRTNLSLPNWC